MGGHARHGVFVWLIGGDAWEDVNLWIVADCRLVHPVECQSLAVGTPEGTLVDAKFVAVNGLAVHDIAAAIGSQLVFLPLCVGNKQLVVFHPSRGFGCRTPVVGRLTADAVLPYRLFRFEIDEQESVLVAHGHDRLVGVGECDRVQVAHIFVVVALCPAVDIVQCKEQAFSSGLLIYVVTLFDVCTY